MDIGQRQFSDEKCKYCAISIDRSLWKSYWERDYLHYKVCTCLGCGRTNSFRVAFFGSGHDAVFGPARSIDGIIRKVCERER